MLILATTTDKLQLVTSAAATLDVHASFQDLSGTSVTPGKQNTAITTAATTDIVAAPAASTFRNVKTLHVRNKHASLATDVTVVFNQNGTTFEIHKVALLSGQALEYIEGVGFFLLSQTAKLFVKVRLVSDVINATTSFADITGLTVALLNGKHYIWEAALFHVNDAATTGSRFGYNIGAAPTAAIIGSIQTTSPNVTTPTFAAGVVSARDTAIAATTAGSTSQMLSMLAGWIQPSADGIFALRCASEVAVASGLTVKAGSWLQVWECDN